MQRGGRDLYKLIEKVHSANTFDRILRNVNILSVGSGRCSAEMRVEERHVNVTGALHPGVSSTLVDLISAYALMTRIDKIHVTVHIHVNFIKEAKAGDCVLLDAWVDKMGKSMAFLGLEARDKETKDLLFKGTHTKFITDVPDETLYKKYVTD